MIDYILVATGATSLHYIGHSQGCTVFFVMAALRPEYNRKIRSMHAMSPAVILPNIKAIDRFIIEYLDQFEVKKKCSVFK